MKKREDIPRLAEKEKIRLDIELEDLQIKKKRPFWLLIFVFLTVLLLACFFILRRMQSNDLEKDLSVEASLTEEGLWQGAFESEEIFNRCKEASVSIISQGQRCSGFVYSSDGWIATVEGAVNENVKGQIEVVLFDGSRFFVEAFRQNRQSGLILMKINASDLKTVSIEEESKVHEGEELFTFCALGGTADGSSLFSGKVAHTKRNVDIQGADQKKRSLRLIQISILLTEEGVGAPFFNEKGALVGIACSGSADKDRYMVDHAFAFSEVRSVLETMKKGRGAEYS